MSIEILLKCVNLMILAFSINIINNTPLILLDFSCEKEVILNTRLTKNEIYQSITKYPKRSVFVTTHSIEAIEYSNLKAALKGFFYKKNNYFMQYTKKAENAGNSKKFYHKLKTQLIKFSSNIDNKNVAYISHFLES